MPRTIHQKECPTCKRKFETTDKRKIRCSRECFTKYASVLFRNRIEEQCRHCEKPIYVKPALLGITKYCSRKCMRAAKTAAGHIKCTCTVCNKKFFRLASRVGPFCSYKCMGMADRKRTTLKCKACGKRFEVLTCHTKGEKARKHCSMKCKRITWALTVRNNIHKRGPTAPECEARCALKQAGIKFIPEHPIGPFVVDFFLPEHKTVLEVDGVYWHSLPSSIARDKAKNAYLKQCGFRVVRITDEFIASTNNLAAVLKRKLGVTKV